MAAVKPGMTDTEALKARRAEIAGIQKESLGSTGLRSDVVQLYQGSEYWLYRYKKYTDVRLVFAPSQQIAFFGGDPDNFTYPRYDLDFALFRVYENGKPVESRNYLKWDPQGPADDALVFVSGNPGSTGRQDTLAQLQMLRDHMFPLTLQILNQRLETLEKYSALGAEQARQASSRIFFLQNSLKAYTGMENGLRNPELMAKKEKEEKEFRARIAANPEWQKEYGTAWDEIAAAEKTLAANLKPYRFRSIGGAPLASRGADHRSIRPAGAEAGWRTPPGLSRFAAPFPAVSDSFHLHRPTFPWSRRCWPAPWRNPVKNSARMTRLCARPSRENPRRKRRARLLQERKWATRHSANRWLRAARPPSNPPKTR